MREHSAGAPDEALRECWEMLKIYRKMTGILTGLVLIVVLGIVGVAVLGPNSLLETSSESRNTQIITAIERQEQIVLLSASIQGLAEEKTQGTWWDRKIFGTGRVQFLQYNYRAKLGVEGRDVAIEQTGDNQYLISIPEFIFIGHDKVEFKTAVEDNGVLSWLTPEIDTAETISKILSADAMAEQITENRDLLQEQASAFYTGIINGVDNEIQLDFEFH